ncbi:PREDICTED: F-box/LRR-repeat protein At4g14103-like [Prunus mume]|uniref:F-box/LRR-repeat protein At4g14103-like n=1 Tax=Prunus mume TaxID=102107 RepID=A0ABM0NL41_PRUMU|nr:PREDICTED: F-box/LRR-repeat protein At4g14103-like [Prunus mume]XP_016648783.1 PREDICTED: F-box/LRR-repeat protein At4g14103-like [Prunus mume]
MGSNSKSREACHEDRISGLPDAIISHILSFLLTREAVRTSVLSHRWKNQWTSVPNLYLRDREYYPLERRLKKSDPDGFSGFVDRVLFFRGSSNIHRFRLLCLEMKDFSRIDAWIRTAIMRNVVELDLELYEYSNPPQPFVFPRSLFMCKTLVVLKLRLQSNFIALAPASDCFPSLKFLHVDVVLPDADSMEKLFSCCPALEDLVIEGEPGYDSVLNFEVSAPKLKRLRISWYIVPFHGNYDRKVFINANVPSLEEFNLQENILANYSLKNAHSLSRAKIDLVNLHSGEKFGTVRDSADRIQWLFAEIRNVKFLSLSAPVFGGPCSVYQYHLPTFNNLNHLELLLQNCCSLRSVTNFLQISPKLEHLVFENSIHCYVCHFVDESVHEWSPPDFVPACLLSHLKTIRIRGFQGLPDEMEVVEYLLKYGAVLNTITICTLEYFCEEKEMKFPVLGLREEVKLLQTISMFPRASKTCQIVFPKLK